MDIIQFQRREISLALKRPDLIAEWHKEKNAQLTPFNVSFGSNKKAWWICQNGHEWSAIINNRSKGAGCPYCKKRFVTFENSLQFKYPDLAKEWHPTKNGDLNPSNIFGHSSMNAWWICENGHEWQRTIFNMVKSRTCPICTNRILTKEYNFAVLFPDISKEWHHQKNAELLPENCMPYSSEKAWWQCSNNHEWMAEINSRAQGAGCPFCAGNKATQERNLLVLYPEIAQTWHASKNGDITPVGVSPRSSLKFWWKCDHGHEWQETVANRTLDCGCPYCSGRRLTPERTLAVQHPRLVREWHPSLNGDLTPYEVTYGSRKRVWWRCRKGHEWSTPIKDRSGGDGCPYCSGLKSSPTCNFELEHPEQAKMWHPTKNHPLKPGDVSPVSGQKVWWQCEQGHEWERIVSCMGWRTKCPYCSGDLACKESNLQIINPDLAQQWHAYRNGNLTPEMVLPKSKKKVWWKCEHDHIWESTIQNRSNGSGCPYCWKLIKSGKAIVKKEIY